MNNIPLSSICSAVIHFHNISECESLSSRICYYCGSPKYMCMDIARKSLKRKSKRNIIRNLESYVDTNSALDIKILGYIDMNHY